MGIDNFNKFSNKYIINVKYEHADGVVKVNYSYSSIGEFDRVCNFFYEIMNFVPGVGYGSLGYFEPITNNNYGNSDRIFDICRKWDVSSDHYLIMDREYNDVYADIDGVKCMVDGDPKVFVFTEAFKYNIISLPKVGDYIDVSVDSISGHNLFGGDSLDYLPNSGKDYLVDSFKARVLDCKIHFYHDKLNRYYHSYCYFEYVILLECSEVVSSVSSATRLTTSVYGYDPEYEVKFSKERYDGLNYYEV